MGERKEEERGERGEGEKMYIRDVFFSCAGQDKSKIPDPQKV